MIRNTLRVLALLSCVLAVAFAVSALGAPAHVAAHTIALNGHLSHVATFGLAGMMSVGGVNTVYARNLYPSIGGATLGVTGSPSSPYDPNNASQSGVVGAGGDVASVDAVPARGFLGQPFTWWFVLAAALLGLKFVAQKLGQGEEFKSIRVSVHNVLVISLASVIGIAFFKVVFNRWKVPGLTTLVNAV